MNKCLHEAFNEFPELKSGIDSVGSAQYISKLNAEIGCKRYIDNAKFVYQEEHGTLDGFNEEEYLRIAKKMLRYGL